MTFGAAILAISSRPTEIRFEPTGATPRMLVPVTTIVFASASAPLASAGSVASVDCAVVGSGVPGALPAWAAVAGAAGMLAWENTGVPNSEAVAIATLDAPSFSVFEKVVMKISL